MSEDHIRVNRAWWDDRATAHATAPDYGFEQFRSDPAHLSEVVRFDLPRLGSVDGLRTAHLQCHIGTDTLSLHRLGAHVTGLDLSPASLEVARALAGDCGAGIDYVESDVLRATDALEPGSFDLVYTGIGALCWLPGLAPWAATVAALLKPGGRLFIREMHPMLGTLEVVDGRIAQQYSYFFRPEPDIVVDDRTYVPTDRPLAALPNHTWSHDLGEIVTSLLDAGLNVTSLTEHDSAAWEALPGFMSPHPDHPGEWRLREHPNSLAATFTLTAERR